MHDRVGRTRSSPISSRPEPGPGPGLLCPVPPSFHGASAPSDSPLCCVVFVLYVVSKLVAGHITPDFGMDGWWQDSGIFFLTRVRRSSS